MMKSCSRGMMKTNKTNKVQKKTTRGFLSKKITSSIDLIAELEVGKALLNYKDKQLVDKSIKALSEELDSTTYEYNSKL